MQKLFSEASTKANHSALVMLLSHGCTPEIAPNSLQNLLQTEEGLTLDGGMMNLVDLLLAKGASGPAVADIASRVAHDQHISALQMLLSARPQQDIVDIAMNGFMQTYDEPLTRKGIRVLDQLVAHSPD